MPSRTCNSCSRTGPTLNKFIYLFIFGCVGSQFLPAGLLYLRRVGATLHRRAWSSHCGGLSRRGACAPGMRASAVGARGLSSCGLRAPEHRLSSCGTQAQPLRGMWDPPGPGIEPMSPALAGGLPTTAPPGKPQDPHSKRPHASFNTLLSLS